MTLEWKIVNVERSLADDVVFKVNYEVYKTDGDNTISASGSTELLKGKFSLSDYANQENFVPFNQLTPEIIISWVQESLGKESVSNINQKMSKQLELKKNPESAEGLPWSSFTYVK